LAVILDTGILYAYYDRADAWHRPALRLLKEEEAGLIVPAPVIPEVDYLLGKRLGPKARHALYRGLTQGDYFVADLVGEQYRKIAELDRRFEELDLGFVDAAVVCIAEALGVRRIATSDRRHFAPLAEALSLELLPAPPS
jgi:hypothetical protein